jgi:hypothetical protein
MDGLVDRRDIDGGVDGIPVDPLDLAELPHVMLAVDPFVEVDGVVAQHSQLRRQSLTQAGGQCLERFRGLEGAGVLGGGHPVRAECTTVPRPDGTLALDLGAHVHGHLDAQQGEDHGREERPLAT